MGKKINWLIGIILVVIFSSGLFVYWIQPKPDIIASGRFLDVCPSEIKECQNIGAFYLITIVVVNNGKKTADNVTIKFFDNMMGVYSVSNDSLSLNSATSTKKFNTFIDIGDLSIGKKAVLFVVGNHFSIYDKIQVSFEGGVATVNFPIDNESLYYNQLKWLEHHCYSFFFLILFGLLICFLYSFWANMNRLRKP